MNRCTVSGSRSFLITATTCVLSTTRSSSVNARVWLLRITDAMSAATRMIASTVVPAGISPLSTRACAQVCHAINSWKSLLYGFKRSPAVPVNAVNAPRDCAISCSNAITSSWVNSPNVMRLSQANKTSESAWFVTSIRYVGFADAASRYGITRRRVSIMLRTFSMPVSPSNCAALTAQLTNWSLCCGLFSESFVLRYPATSPAISYISVSIRSASCSVTRPSSITAFQNIFSSSSDVLSIYAFPARRSTAASISGRSITSAAVIKLPSIVSLVNVTAR